MLDFLKKLMEGDKADAVDDGERLRLAAAALLFRALYVDGEAHPSEEAQVRRVVEEEFGLEGEAVDRLLADARQSAETATDLYGWTKLVNAEYSDDDKLHLMELMWRVVLADGVIDENESALMRRLAGLIHVSDADSALARNRAKKAM